MPVSCDLEVMWPDGPVACESENGLVRIRSICVHEHMEDAGCCALHLTLASATRAGLDRELDLHPAGPGRWQAAAGPVPAGRWDLVLDAPQGWRLVGEWDSVAQSAALEPVPGEAAQ